MVEVNERHYNKTSGATVINEEHIWSGTVMNSPLLKRWVLFYIRGELCLRKKLRKVFMHHSRADKCFRSRFYLQYQWVNSNTKVNFHLLFGGF